MTERGEGCKEDASIGNSQPSRTDEPPAQVNGKTARLEDAAKRTKTRWVDRSTEAEPEEVGAHGPGDRTPNAVADRQWRHCDPAPADMNRGI